jgi:hypothetical protein
VAALTAIQVTDAAVGTVVMAPVNGVLNGATITNAAGAVTIMVNGSPAHEHNGGPVVGTQYVITHAHGNFPGVQFLVSAPFLYRFQ